MKERFCCGQPLKSNKKIAPLKISAPLNLILRAPSPASHEWKSVPAVKRLCQVCHLVVDGQGLRCKCCGLKVHPQCGSSYPSNFDTTDSNLKKTGGRDIRDGNFNRQRSKSQTHQDSIFYKHFEPRIKKIVHAPLLSSIESGCEERHSGASSSARFSSCGDSVAASTAIVVGTVSIETPRSESKTPEITITPGSEVTAVEVGTEIEIEARLLSSSASELPDSGCGGLLDEDEDSQRAESTQPDARLRFRSEDQPDTPGVSPSSQEASNNQRLLYVDGPIDGSPYAVINPIVKQKSWPDSGFSFGVNQMKDLDRLISALVQEAESIDTNNSAIPYHARQDSLPFSYTSPQSIASQAEKLHHTHPNQRDQSRHQSQSSYSTVDTGRVNYYSPSPVYATPAPADTYPSSRARSTRTDDYGKPSLDQQFLVNQQPAGGLSRSISHQPSYSTSHTNYGRSQPTASHQMHSSLSSNSFNYGNGTSGVRTVRNRSQSADARKGYERDEDPDEWLARQMKKLQEKKASKHVVRPDWLAELKRALPQTERSQSQMDYNSHSTTVREFRPSEISNEFRPSQISREIRPAQTSNQFRPLQISRAETTQVPPANQTPTSTAETSDDDDDVEMEMFQGRRKIQRHYSESAYDRGYTSSSSRAPSQQSNYTETPFPICPPTPYTNRPISPPGKPPRSPKAVRKYQGASSAPISTVVDVVSSRMERAQTPVNPRPIYMVDSEVKFAQDLSELWYKPYASREETVSALVQSPPGFFIIRNSNSFPGAYGLAIKVGDSSGEKGIRHFLIEPTKFGVRIRGQGTLEPVFGSLSALVCAHSIERLALPTTLQLPSYDILPSSQSQSTTAHLLKQGAACQLLFIGMVGVECLTGEEAILRGVNEISAASPVPISLRLSKSGLSITDVFRKQFFRIHFALNEILYTSIVNGRSVSHGRENKQVFGIVARAPRSSENSVILLSELESGQPANAVVGFIQRVLAWQH